MWELKSSKDPNLKYLQFPPTSQRGLLYTMVNQPVKKKPKKSESDTVSKQNSEETHFQTRVCIQNLPRHNHLDEKRLRSLVASTITDVKWMGRRMAIVGLETAQEAADVIEKLHGTYCDTSKLTVEYARKTRKGGQLKERKSGGARKDGTDIQANVGKKQKDGSEETKKSVPGKRKFWANDDDDEMLEDRNNCIAKVQNEPKSVLDDTMAFLRSKQTTVDDLGDDLPDDEETGQKEPSGELTSSPALDKSRLFIRNLPYTVTAEQVGEHFESYGTLVDCHIAYDDVGNSKGFGFVKFTTASSAQTALEELDGTEFYGRILGVIPARPGSTTTTNHQNAGFVRQDAVLDTLASRMNVSQSSVLAVKDGLSAGDAAVRMALAETAIVQENKDFLESYGVSEGSDRRSRTCFLIKNLPHDTAVSDLQALFQTASSVDLAPSHTLAIVKFLDPATAQQSYKRYAYRRFKNVPLYLEWAPVANPEEEKSNPTSAPSTDNQDGEEELVGPTATLYVKNLNFETTEEGLRQFFDDFPIRSVRIPQKVSSVRGRLVNQSMGYGFVEFEGREVAQKALAQRQGGSLDNYKLELQPRNEKDAGSSTKSGTKSGKKGKNKKLVVRNVPFQATRSELLQLFGSFGTIRNIRLPKKFNGSHRGFCFIEYVDDAEPARQANTHLYGRHLVIDYAEDEDS